MQCDGGRGTQPTRLTAMLAVFLGVLAGKAGLQRWVMLLMPLRIVRCSLSLPRNA